MNTAAAQAIQSSVKSARKYALEGQYGPALTFYAGLDRELATHIQSTEDPTLKAKWQEFRTKWDAERQSIVELQAELAALVDPAEAVRRDRQLARGDAPDDPTVRSLPPPPSNGGYGNPYVVRPRPSGGGGGGYAGGSLPTNDDEDYTAPLRQLQLGMGGGGGGRRGGAGAPPTAVINEHLYGDRDRFGPPEGPAVPRAQSSPKVGASPQARVAPVRQAPPPSQAGPSSAQPNAARGKVKPPLPKFAKKSDNANGGGGGGVDGRPRFVPRPGEEELASLIEGDMCIGNLTVTWDDIAGQKEAKGCLEEAVVYPIMMPDFYQGIRRPWKGVLMYGPPGTGKTMLAKAVASECQTTFFNISPATLTSKWRGEGEKLIRVLFDMARHYAPSTIFIDEIDSLCGQRGSGDEHEASRRAKGVLLTQMDGVGVDNSKIVMVLGATNHPWDIDDAMRRRLEKRIYIPLPDYADRIELFGINTKTIKLAPDVDFARLSRLLEDHYYSAADITTVVRDASMQSLRRFMNDDANKKEIRQRGQEIGKLAAEQPTTMDDFINAIRKVPSSVNVEQIRKYEEWKKEFETVV